MDSTRSRTFVLVLALALALVLVAVLTTPALAAPPYDGAAFGEHVSSMAQEGHLGTEHNPGMHKGITGWMHGSM